MRGNKKFDKGVILDFDTAIVGKLNEILQDVSKVNLLRSATGAPKSNEAKSICSRDHVWT